MYISLNKSFLTRTKEEASTDAIEELGESDAKNTLLYADLDQTVENLEIEDDKISISVNTKLGFFSFDIPLGVSELEELLTVVIRRMNKIKTLLQSVK